MREGVIVSIILLVAGIVVIPAIGEPFIPDSVVRDKNEKPRHCWDYWTRTKKFVEDPADYELTRESYLFDPEGPEKYADYYKRIERQSCYKPYLIVYYGAFDNDLAPFGQQDIREMESVGSNAWVDVLVFLDDDSEGLTYYHIAKNKNPFHLRKAFHVWLKAEHGSVPKRPTTKKKRKEWRQWMREKEKEFLAGLGSKHIVSPKVVTLEEGDSGNVRTAGTFYRWAFKNYPAREIIAIMGSHGEGYSTGEVLRATEKLEKKFSSRQGGVAFDYTSGTHMNVNQMAIGLKTLLKEMRSPSEGKYAKLAIGLSDACLNQQVAFGYEWNEVFEFVIGSHALVQNKGFNYHSLIGEFAKRPGHIGKWRTMQDFAKRIPDVYKGSILGQGSPYASYYDRNATMASWATGSMHVLHRAMHDLGTALNNWIHEVEGKNAQLERKRVFRKFIQQADRKGGLSTDFVNFLQRLENWARNDHKEIHREVLATRKALTFSVIHYFVGPDYQQGLTITSKGVSVWLPWNLIEYFKVIEGFKKSKLYRHPDAPTNYDRQSGWADFVIALYG